MKTNTKTVSSSQKKITENDRRMLERAVVSCFLWENQFYEDGVALADRIAQLVPRVDPADVARIAINARRDYGLKHVPLLVVREMCRHATHKPYVENTLVEVCTRPDFMCEFLALYWKDGKTPIAASAKRGLARAFLEFNEYQLAKWNRDSDIKLLDVMRLVHPIPQDSEQETMFGRLKNDTLKTPDTWEVHLSAQDGRTKREKWEWLLQQGLLGDTALLMNLRNMSQENVDDVLIFKALSNIDGKWVFPYQYIQAAQHAPQYHDPIEKAMLSKLDGMPKLNGVTDFVIDVSASMHQRLASKSEMTRLDAACALAILLASTCENYRVYTFSSGLVKVNARPGFALKDLIVNSQPHQNTHMRAATLEIQRMKKTTDRVIIISDEQSQDGGPIVWAPKSYMINVSSYENRLDYNSNGYHSIYGFSTNVYRWLYEYELLMNSYG